MHSALLGGCGLLVILGRFASRVCRMVPGKSSTGSFAVGKHHNRRCRCQQWAIPLGEPDSSKSGYLFYWFLSDRTFVFGAGSSFCAWASVDNRSALSRTVFARMART